MTELATTTEDAPKVTPLGLKYIRVTRIFLWTIGAWPGEILGEVLPLPIRFHRRWGPIQCIFSVAGQVYYLSTNYAMVDFFVKGHCFINIFLTIMTIARATLPNLSRYNDVIKDFLMSFHLIHFRHKSAYYEKMFTLIDRVSFAFSLFLMVMMVFGMMLFNLFPVYHNFKIGAFTGTRVENTTLDFSVFYSFPKFDLFDHFKIVTMFNMYLSYLCATNICAIDLLMSVMVFQIIGHILILRNELETITRPKKQTAVEFNDTNKLFIEMYDQEENKSIHTILKNCVDHHRLIVNFTDSVSNFFGPMLALNYSFHLVSCCLLLLECSQGDFDALMRFGPLTIIIFGQLIQISVTFEIVNTVSEKLANSAYLTPWECMDTQNRRIVCVILHRVQTPLQVTAMGITPVGVTTMAGILKTTFSYFAFLSSLNV